MAELNEINDDQNYEVQVDVLMTPQGTLRQGEILTGRTLKAMLVYNLSPNEPLTSFIRETNQKVTN